MYVYMHAYAFDFIYFNSFKLEFKQTYKLLANVLSNAQVSMQTNKKSTENPFQVDQDLKRVIHTKVE